MIGKAMLNLDQATSHLDPTFAPAQCIRDNVSEIFASSLRATPGGLLSAAIEAKDFTAQLPKRANRILDAMAAGEFRLRVDAAILTAAERYVGTLDDFLLEPVFPHL